MFGVVNEGGKIVMAFVVKLQDFETFWTSNFDTMTNNWTSA